MSTHHARTEPTAWPLPVRYQRNLIVVAMSVLAICCLALLVR